MKTKTCRNCNAENRLQDDYCWNCGEYIVSPLTESDKFVAKLIVWGVVIFFVVSGIMGLTGVIE